MTSHERGGGDSVSDGNAPGRLASIESLPDELLQSIFCSLSKIDLKSAALASKCFHRHATDFLWHHVALVDKWTLHTDQDTKLLYTDRGCGEPDEHDDTPIIHKLYILATNPALAAKVHVLTHRCHLPTPNIFSEISTMYFHAENLSADPRVHTLLVLAIANMVSVHTLRIIYGHHNLTQLLLGAFLDPGRHRRIRLRKLWLESCSLMGFESFLTSPSHSECLNGLESLRVRRLRAESADSPQRSRMRFMEFRLARGGHPKQLHNAAGSWLWSTVEYSREGVPPAYRLPPLGQYNSKARGFDEWIWDELPEIQLFVDSSPAFNHTPILSLTNPLMLLLETSVSTLTSLNLDWLLWRQKESDEDLPALRDLKQLAQLRFPHLRAFQLRNAVVQETLLPDGVYLLEDTFLDFIEAHLKIQCLAWPLDRFYSHSKPTTAIRNRTRKIVAHLGNMLVDLRVDSAYSTNGETVTDESHEIPELQECVRRRRFISEFAPHMLKVERLKLEGGMPRDEKREIVRALHFSRLKKLVLIGVTFPVGNTWGPRGDDLVALDPEQSFDAAAHLEAEDLKAILASYRTSISLPKNFEFEAQYGWRSETPFLQTIALHHASTIEEIKLCGYNGSPILSSETRVTGPLLYPLRHFHNLRQLVVSFWLLTYFEDDYRDEEIIQSWMDTRSPASTALVVVTPPASPAPTPPVDPGMMPNYLNAVIRPQAFNRWAVALKTRFTPSALAYRVAVSVGPHLSSAAKARPGGVSVRASFCLGEKGEIRSANDIFDLDMRIGANDQVLEFVGPREEVEPTRFWQKLDGRRWF